MKPFMKKPIKADIRIPLCRMAYGCITIFTFILLSCNGQKKALGQNTEGSRTDSLLTLVLRDDYSGLDSEEMQIVTNAKQLQQFFTTINKTRKPGLPLPSVDFSKETVLIYCSGEKKGRVLPKLSIKEITDEAIVITSILEEKQEKSTSNAVISPFSIYTIPSTQKKIIFQKNR